MEVYLHSQMPSSSIENIEFYKGSFIGKTNNIMRKQYEKLMILEEDVFKQFSGKDDKNVSIKKKSKIINNFAQSIGKHTG